MPSMLCEVDLIAILVTLGTEAPMVLIKDGNTLPAEPLDSQRASLQRGFHHWAEKLTGCGSIDTMEQLYTFADQTEDGASRRLISISYLAISRDLMKVGNALKSFYEYFPWEDRRSDSHTILLSAIVEQLMKWAKNHIWRIARIQHYFGLQNNVWDDEKVLDRYELLWEAGLVGESATGTPFAFTGMPMAHDHRRILATAFSRIRSKVRYSAMIFSFLPEIFTFNHLQQAMETITGRLIHKSNFRRLVLNQKLLEETNHFQASSPGRPARLYRFCQKRDVSCYLAGANLPFKEK